MKDALFFNTMLPPKIITFVYWIMLLLVLLASINTMFTSWDGFSFSSFLVGVFYILMGTISARISCELLIVLFTMNESLQKLNNKENQ